MLKNPKHQALALCAGAVAVMAFTLKEIYYRREADLIDFVAGVLMAGFLIWRAKKVTAGSPFGHFS